MALSRPVVLFGYDSSPFTQKIRFVLRCKQIPYTFVKVPSMLPRPILRDSFHLMYRRIPQGLTSFSLYCDTSIITEALEYQFPYRDGYGSIYPLAADGRDYRPIMRGFANYWITGPFYRVTTGLIPSSVWKTDFANDRASLIGHKLDPNKLEAKLPRNYSAFDMHLSMLEPLFQDGSPKWMFSTPTPSLADIALYIQLNWGMDVASGRGIEDLTAGATSDTDTKGTVEIFNRDRYPGFHKWFHEFRGFFDGLPLTETVAATPESVSRTLEELKSFLENVEGETLLPTPNKTHSELDERNGLILGSRVFVAPDDTGRDHPTFGTLLAMSPEEVVIRPDHVGGDFDVGGKSSTICMNIHFPRSGFVVKPAKGA